MLPTFHTAHIYVLRLDRDPPSANKLGAAHARWDSSRGGVVMWLAGWPI